MRHLTGFYKGSLPLLYLGVPRPPFFNHLTTKVKTQLHNWKVKMLSMMRRIQLVNFVVGGLLNYSSRIYERTNYFIKDMKMLIRNFIWSASINDKGLVTMKWNKMCRPKQEGGLRIINLNLSNQAVMLKLAWEFKFEKSIWANIMRKIFFKSTGSLLAWYIASYIWPGLKPHLINILKHTRWILWDGKTIHF